MATSAAGLVSTTVSTDQLAPLGFELLEPASSGADTNSGEGQKIWVYVQNNAAAATAWTAGKVIMRLAGASTHQGVLTPVAVVAPMRMLGVTQHAIPSGSFGFILKRGIGVITAGNGAALTVDTLVATAGTVVLGPGLDAVANANAPLNTVTEAVGWCTVGAVAGANATCWIDCKGS